MAKREFFFLYIAGIITGLFLLRWTGINSYLIEASRNAFGEPTTFRTTIGVVILVFLIFVSFRWQYKKNVKSN